MVIIFTILALLMGGSMFFISHDKKIALMFIGCMILTLLRMNIPIFTSANFLLIGCFLLSEFSNWKAMVKRWMRNPVGKVLIIVLLSVLLCIINSPHLHEFKDAISFLRNELLLKYFALGYTFYSIRNEKGLRTIIRYSIIPMFVLTFLGIVNLLEQRSAFVNEMMSNWASTSAVYELAGDAFTDSERFRVQAMFVNPFDYGYICLLCLLLYIYGYTRKVMNKNLFSVLLFCCIFGILLCGCRTIVVCSVLGVITILLLAYRLGKSLTYCLAALALATLSYMTVPVVNEKVDEMLTVFSDTSGREIGGSNIDMRSVQFAAVLYHIKDSPAFGRGVKFFYYDMGWEDGRQGLKDSRLMGIEGVYLGFLLERGFIGYFLYLSVWIIILIYLYKHRSFRRKLSALGISVWVVYTAFANMTGELLSVFPTLLIIGAVLGVMNTNEKLQENG